MPGDEFSMKFNHVGINPVVGGRLIIMLLDLGALAAHKGAELPRIQEARSGAAGVAA